MDHSYQTITVIRKNWYLYN